MKVSKKGQLFIQEWEGLSLTIYLDQGGKATIGYGHLIVTPKSGSVIVQSITPHEATLLFEDDIRIAEKSINEMIKTPMTQGQFDALVSLVFNIGRRSFIKSKALNLLNKLQYNNAAHEFFSEQVGFIHVAGKKNKGLVNRRAAELEMWKNT